MPALKDSKREAYCQARVSGKTIEESQEAAGYAKNKPNGCRLEKRPEVAARLTELKEKAAEKVTEKTAIDAAWVLEKAANLHDKAMEAKAFSAAKGALDIIGKHVDVQAFREQMHHSGLIEYKNLSDEEVDARIRAHEQARASDSRPTKH